MFLFGDLSTLPLAAAVDLAGFHGSPRLRRPPESAAASLSVAGGGWVRLTAHTRAGDVPAGDHQGSTASWMRLGRHGSRRQPVAAVLLVPQAAVAAQVQLARCSLDLAAAS